MHCTGQQERMNFVTPMPFTSQISFFSKGHRLNDNWIKIFSYNLYQRNKSGERSGGVAIAVKKGLQHRIIDDFDQEFLVVEVDTSRGPINLATEYLPPRCPSLPYPDLLRLLRLHTPVYLLEDFNAHHRTRGNTDNNIVGSSMVNNRLKPLGPDFPTLICHNSAKKNEYHTE